MLSTVEKYIQKALFGSPAEEEAVEQTAPEEKEEKHSILKCDLAPDELPLTQCCCSLSSQIYESVEHRNFPDNAGTLLFESTYSEKYVLPFLIFNSEVFHAIIVVYRGTRSFSDIIVDLRCGTVDVKGGVMHAGVYLTSVSMAKRSLWLAARYAEERDKDTIILTGHSLGASVAARVSYMAQNKLPQFHIRSIVFAPAASISRNLSEISKGFCTSFVMEGDFVPNFSLNSVAKATSYWPSSIAHFIHEQIVARKEETRKSVEKIRFTLREQAAQAIVDQFPDDLDVHMSEEFPDETVPLFPPGNIYVMRMPDKNTLEMTQTNLDTYFDHLSTSLSPMKHTSAGYTQFLNSFTSILESS